MGDVIDGYKGFGFTLVMGPLNEVSYFQGVSPYTGSYTYNGSAEILGREVQISYSDGSLSIAIGTGVSGGAPYQIAEGNVFIGGQMNINLQSGVNLTDRFSFDLVSNATR